jgi:dihydrofolate reductase
VKEGKATPDMFAGGVKHYAFSRKPPKKVLFGFEFVNEPIKKFVKRLRAERGKDIWMMGGASIIRSFLDADAIDEFIIHVIPTFIGEGIPLIAPKRRTLPLKLLSTKKYPDGVVRLHYQVIRQK